MCCTDRRWQVICSKIQCWLLWDISTDWQWYVSICLLMDIWVRWCFLRHRTRISRRRRTHITAKSERDNRRRVNIIVARWWCCTSTDDKTRLLRLIAHYTYICSLNKSHTLLLIVTIDRVSCHSFCIICAFSSYICVCVMMQSKLC